MADIALRSPQFKYIEIPATGVLSTVCTITINQAATPVYTLTKNVAPSTTAYFDISELVRDYLEIEYKANFVPQSIFIETQLKNYSLVNGGGVQVGGTITFSDRGYEAYGIYEQGTNPTLLESWRTSPTFLISADTSVTPPRYEILAPQLQTGTIPYLANNGTAASVSYSPNSSSVTIVTTPPITCNIKRIGCTKYGEGRKIIFINKYGVQQELWFFLKNTESISRKNEGYKSNTLFSIAGANPPAYDIQDAPKKVFNTQANKTHVLSSGYYPEQANDFFEQLLLSEYVWLEVVRDNFNPIQNEIIPVKVKNSSINFKTSLNDRLIEYTMEFEDAFDYINNIR